MAFPGEAILTDLIRRFVDKTIKEFSYFRHFETLECEFKRVQELWERKLEKAQVDIKDAKRYNQYQNDREIQNWIAEAENWIVEAENLIQNKAEIRSRRLDSCCLLRQFRQGKRLAQKTLTIQEHIQKCNFGIMAGPAELLDMKYHASRDFFDFESRKTEFEQLVKALKDCNIIGLQGMGGTGKTTLATQVGKHVEESKTFEKVVFVVVSNPIDVIKIQGDIAGQLPLRLDKIEEADRSLMLWSSIVKNATKLLIILDDVWEELNLKRIGIPSGPDHKNCYVLITTRQSKVCRAMKCQEIVCLSTLNDEDALRLFLFHAASDDVDSSRNELEGLARDFLKECGGLPLAIVALASTLRNWHVGELNVVLTTLKNSKSFIDVAEDLVEVYSCLKLSYDYLHNEKAQKLFLLCSIFPEDYEFPVNLVIRLVIGLGIFEEADVYCETRTQALAVKNKLIDSSLLQKVEEEDCVKMHDLVREVAQWIAKEDIQVIKDSIITLKTNTRYACWSVDDFPDQFAETNLEILLLWISGNVLEKDPNAFFARMSRLKILFLLGECDRKVYAPSLLKSLLSLKCIQTLILDGWDLGDISILNNLQSLVTLEFKNCQIMELPRNIRELKKLRWLGMRNCEIEKNNPFEVIEKCSQLEEVYFVENSSVKNWNTEDDKEIVDEIAQEKSPAELQIFSIAYAGFERFAGVDNGLLRCFKSKHIKHLISDAMFKNLVRSAQVLELGEIRQSWKNLAPDIIPLENQGLDNLIKLYLYEWDDIECLIDNSKCHYSDTTFFPKLVELHLYGVDVEKLYRGAVPSRFLRQLQILKLEECMKLENIFLDENIKLPHLKELRLIGCPMFQPSIFHPSVAQSLERLEELEVEDCEELKCLIEYERLKEDMTVVGSQNNYDLLFPVLKYLRIRGCGKLEMVFSLLLPGDLPKLKDLSIWGCEELKYIFGEYRVVGQLLQQEIILPLLTEVTLCDVPSFISVFENCVLRQPQVSKEDLKEKHANSKASAFSWAHGCCFLALTKHTNAMMEHHTISQEIKKHMQDVTSESAKESELQEIVDVETPLTPPSVCFQYFLNFHNLKKIDIMRNRKLKTLFSVSACRNLPRLSKLIIGKCEELVNVVEDDSHDHHHMNSSSIFPKLEDLSIKDCNKLEFIFPLSLFGTLQKLKSLKIEEAAELKYIFWNENDQLQIHLPALEALSLLGVPKMINKILARNYYLSFPCLQSIGLGDLQEFNGRSFLDLMAYLQEMQLNEDLMKIIKDMQKLAKLGIRDSKIEEVLNLEGVEIEGTILMLSLEEMRLKDLSELNHICKGPKYILSLPNLRRLNIIACKKLRVIFNVSIVKSLPQLYYLKIEDCNELVDIIEGHLHQICFPKLDIICINRCNSLKCLLSISTCVKFPMLRLLKIEEASELEQVFIHKQDDMQEMTMMDEVFPKLLDVILRKLPRLVTICEGIDFQNVRCTVNDCPKYQGNNHIQEWSEDGDLENQAATNASPDFAESSKEAMMTSVEEVASSFSKKETVNEIEAKDPTPALLEKQALEGSTTKPQLRSTSLYDYKEIEKEGGRVVPDPASKLAAPTSSSFQSIDVSLKEISEQGPTLEDVVVADLRPRNSSVSLL